jgi:hypothetical protein
METPVICFCTDVARPVKVAASFIDGLMKQFHPPPELIAPPSRTCASWSRSRRSTWPMSIRRASCGT